MTIADKLASFALTLTFLGAPLTWFTSWLFGRPWSETFIATAIFAAIFMGIFEVINRFKRVRRRD